MKPGRLQEAAAAAWATAALLHGGLTLYNHSQAVRAESTADENEQRRVYSATYEEEIAFYEGNRNIYGGLTVLNLGVAGLFSYLAVTERREREE
jgi:hypothetical protein